LPERDRFPAFCEEILRRILTLDIVHHGTEPFRGTIDIRRAGAVDIANIGTSSAEYVRTRNLVRDGAEAAFVILPVRGDLYCTQGGQPYRIDLGTGAICDSTKTGGLRSATDAQFWSLKIERDWINGLIPQVKWFAGMKLNEGGALQLLLGYLEGMIGRGFAADRRAAQLHSDHLLDLIALALGAIGDAAEIANSRGARAARLQAIKRDILGNFARQDLSVTALAARHGISPRYVQMLFDREGTTFTEFVVQQRLARAYRMLNDPGYADHTISRIAFAVGFGDLSYFNRTFRCFYGATPSDVRAQARRAG
jgi:AraC-like DNA-binding protein